MVLFAKNEAIEGFSSSNNVELSSLDQWVEHSGSAYAYMSRGAYYVAEGWLARGDKPASRTSDEQFKAQSGYHRKAVAPWPPCRKMREVSLQRDGCDPLNLLDLNFPGGLLMLRSRRVSIANIFNLIRSCSFGYQTPSTANSIYAYSINLAGLI
ncbi:MAG: hypothetical protein V7629_09060 [Motiliproteus sp.]